MQLFFEIIEGDRTGSRVRIRSGLTIGRKNADFILRDSKVSGLHARVEERRPGEFVLIDAGSSNGIKIDGLRLDEVSLTPGVSMLLGRTLLKVVTVESEEALVGAVLVEPWTETLARLCRLNMAKIKAEPRELAAFNPQLELSFITGPQTGEIWRLGYGPRALGPQSLDLKIDALNAPGICFEVLPKRRTTVFRTEFPHLVRLNGRELKEETLAEGDVIEIHKTQIRVSFKSEE